jgi:hypothetical protein
MDKKGRKAAEGIVKNVWIPTILRNNTLGYLIGKLINPAYDYHTIVGE